jgi:neurofibromin 1
MQALGKASVKPTGTLAENPHWNEIASLSRLALVASQQSKQLNIAQFYMPELIHIITLIAATGEVVVRSTIWGLVMDLLQSLWLSRSSDAIAGPEIRLLHEEGSNVETLKLFGLSRTPWTNELMVYNPATDGEVLDCQEGLTRFLIRVMEAAAQTKGEPSTALTAVARSHFILRITQRVASSLDELGYGDGISSLPNHSIPRVCCPRRTGDSRSG